MKKAILWLMIWLLPVMLGACSSGGGGDSGGGGGGGGGGGSNATALTVATQVSVVDAKLTGSVAGVAPLKFSWFKAVAADFASTSDYTADKTQIWVSERSAEAFEEINNILCMVAQTKYDAMLNQGNYIALVDNNQCDSSKSDASSAGQESQNQSSSAEMPDYMTFVINSSRLNNTSDEIVKVWVHEKARPDKQEPEKVIFVKLTVTESVSDTNPYGLFHMEFIGYPSTNGVPDTSPNQIMFKGLLRSRLVNNEVILELVEENYGQWGGGRQIALNKKADGTGTGTVQESHPLGTVVSQFDIAFDPSYFKRSDGTNSMCLSRSQFEESAWRYGLYDSTGKRVNRNSGFSVNTMADGSGSYGWVGYWGLWLDNNATVVNNTLYKYDYSTGSATPYTLFKAGGKLKKHTKNNLTLLEVKGIPLDFWDNGTNYRVVWDGTNFNKVAQMPSNCTNNCMWSDIAAPYPTINFNQVQWSELNFWSQSLGGQVRVPLPGCTWTDPDGPMGPTPGYTICTAPNNSTLVIFFKEDIVYPTDTIPASLVCYDNCLKAGATGIDPMDSTYSSWDPNTGQSTAHNYTFNTGTMLLSDSTSSYNVVSSSTSTMNQWGYMSGALVDTTTPNLATLLDCNWDGDNNPATNAQVCGWKAWSVLDVFYTWETGPNNWNQLSLLQDTVTSATLTFEPPLQVKYIHHKAGSPLDGATFMMDYSGFGQLNGIPGKCVNMETGIDADCSSGGPDSPIRWVPAFVIPPTQADGSLTEVTADTVTYYVKPLEMEQRMKQDAGGCSGLTITPYPLPSISDWVNPSIGTEPAVTAPPAVIGGVVQ